MSRNACTNTAHTLQRQRERERRHMSMDEWMWLVVVISFLYIYICVFVATLGVVRSPKSLVSKHPKNIGV